MRQFVFDVSRMRVGKGLKFVALLVAPIAAGAAVVHWYQHEIVWHGHESDYTVSCASNLKQIGQAVQAYADANDGAYPPSLDAIDQAPRRGHRDVRVCPSAEVGRDVSLRNWVGLAPPLPASYRYVGGGLNARTVAADSLVIVERIDNHPEDRVNVLHGDGHVECLQIGRYGRLTPRWLDVEQQIARGDRPVQFRVPAVR